MFKPGFCPLTGNQVQVKDEKGRIANGLPGSQLCWLTLNNENGIPFARIGTIAICKSKPVDDLTDEEIIQIKENLVSSKLSGIKANEPEFSRASSLGIELIKVY